MIKRYSTSVFFFLLFITSIAQKIEYAVELGMALSYFDKQEVMSGDPQYDGYKKTVLPSFEIDLPVDLWLAKSFALSSGLNYTERGGAFRIKNEDYILINSTTGSKEGNVYDNFRYRLKYFEIPLTAKFDLFRIFNIGNDDKKLRLSSGIVPMLNIASKTVDLTHSGSGSKVKTNRDQNKLDGAERLLTSWIVKVEWTSGKANPPLMFYASFAQNISNIYDTSKAGYENYDVSMSVVSFGLGALLGK